jgi:hypothetical protein
MRERGRGSRVRLFACAAVLVLALAAVPSASAALSPAESLTYIPFGFIHDEHSVGLREETLEQLNAYGVGQMILPLPNFKRTGLLKLSRKELGTIPAWVASTAAYNLEHGTDEVAVASFGGKVKGKSLNLEEPAVRANMVAGIERVLAMGVGAVSLDLEPYPSTHGFVLLLEEIDAAFAHRGFTGRLSVTAPATAGRSSPQQMAEVTPLLDQIDPMFYDSERKTVAAYQQWVRDGLAYYSQHTAPGTRIVPDLPSYGPNKWHDIAVENLSTATTAVEEALQQGSRVNGAGFFWWWGFYYNEEGEGAYNGAPDRATWLGRTLSVPFTP